MSANDLKGDLASVLPDIQVRVGKYLASLATSTQAGGTPGYHYTISPTRGHKILYPEPINEGIDPAFLLTFIFGSIFVTCLFIIILTHLCRDRLVHLSEEEIIREEENQAYLELDSDEQELYFQSKEYIEMHPPKMELISPQQQLLIQEKGIQAWDFVKNAALTNNELIVINKTELNFFHKSECSVQTNIPMPNRNEVYYFESKLFYLPNPEETVVSIGLAHRPYPFFRLPGRHRTSLSYDSDGHRRHNQPFPFKDEAGAALSFPCLQQGDVVGVGYRPRTGVVFFTRNGKRINEASLGGHIKLPTFPSHVLYPIVGANNLCSVHVNIGQMGFVFIEANVKKWGFAPLEGTGPAPPRYDKFNKDIILERSDVDENDLESRANDFPPDFWQLGDFECNGEEEDDLRCVLNADQASFQRGNFEFDEEVDENITLKSLPQHPPIYHSGSDEEQSDEGGPEGASSEGLESSGAAITEDLNITDPDITIATYRTANNDDI
ncbi:hypothetical protein BABINDRAFT_160935 [Babjeviella inositovora NRRL Y-12698]|uniref:B30.2/SPRY domain-containing protein n=1 Tax=Babjeviella inositovora NRRL Y-12698 TaxID=984486 RepID=A0A1E3QSM2_9ASCO|nr:uncharacterized protein BABINDRAFT_160935 [Babjeviella inositovora NRRL Y-12698]ODQ80703.1 hypothetical protein BABINDRAFT_160935 [Babjeviella inositovora NRRL Y-12698]